MFRRRAGRSNGGPLMMILTGSIFLALFGRR